MTFSFLSLAQAIWNIYLQKVGGAPMPPSTWILRFVLSALTVSSMWPGCCLLFNALVSRLSRSPAYSIIYDK